MRVLKSNSKVVFVATGGKGCPRVSITKAKTKFRDDYRGKLYVKKGIAKYLFSSL